MKKFTTLLLLIGSYLSQGQNSQTEINDQVWKPFIKTFNERDADGFMALHSKDLVRSARDGNSIINWDRYYDNVKKSAERDKTSGRKTTIELRFLERVASTNQAIDVGIYKTSYVFSDGKTEDYYGKFLVVLRKENNTWKILVDTDSTEGGTINEKNFLDAKSIDN